MKLAAKLIEGFLAPPPKQCTTLFLYGADQGLVRHYRDKVLLAWGIERTDPFRCNEYAMAAIKADPAIVQDGLSAVSMMGGAPCMIITEANDDLTDPLKEARANPQCSNPLIIMAGEISTKSSLRTWCEDPKRMDVATTVCYREEGANLAQTVRAVMHERRIQCAPPVMQLLTSLLGNDRAVTMQELEKIDLYLGDRRQLTEEDVLALLTDNKHQMASDALLAWIQGNMARFWSGCDRLYAEGESPIALTRFALNLVNRLLTIHKHMREGTSRDQAMKWLSPPVFFKDEPAYSAAVQMWSVPQPMQLHDALMMIELNCKRHSTWGDTFFMHTMVEAVRMCQTLHQKSTKVR